MSPQLIASEMGVYEPPSRVECRVYERYPTAVAASCQPIAARGPGDLKWSATVRDVSLGGIGLVISRRFERGAGLAVELPEGDSDSFYTALARVVHVRAQADGSWLHGCALVGELSEDGLKALLRPAPQRPGLPAQESAPPSGRFAPTGGQEQQPAPSGEGTSAPHLIRGVHLKCGLGGGRVIHRFVTRLNVSVPWPLARGTIVRGRVGKGPTDRPAVWMEVSSCHREGTAWTLTCKIVDVTPGQDPVLLFRKSRPDSLRK